MANIDMLCGICTEYADQCRSRRVAATAAGFLIYVEQAQPQQAQGTGEDAVQVLTYHKAKGLEWPIVIMASLDSNKQADPFGVKMVESPEFDPDMPLAKRSIRYWPWAMGRQEKFDPLDSRLANRPETLSAIEKDRRESHRLLYVGMTRAKDSLIFAVRKHVTKKGAELKTGWLDLLTGAEGCPLLKLPLDPNSRRIDVGGQEIEITVREIPVQGEGQSINCDGQNVYLWPYGNDPVSHPPCRIVPSRLDLTDDALLDVKIELLADLGGRIKIGSRHDTVDLGNAIHGFLGTDCSFAESSSMDRQIAAGLLSRWGVADDLTVDDMLDIRRRLVEFIEKRFPGARIYREWPVSIKNARNQRAEGWIDMLLELDDGYVIVDHKSYPKADYMEHSRSFAPQLLLYKKAVEAAGGKPVTGMLIHLPVLGKILRLTGGKLDIDAIG